MSEILTLRKATQIGYDTIVSGTNDVVVTGGQGKGLLQVTAILVVLRFFRLEILLLTDIIQI